MFDQIARRLVRLVEGGEEDVPQDDLERQAVANTRAEVVKELHLIWNARGAADLAIIDADEDGYVSELLDVRDALRTLDR